MLPLALRLFNRPIYYKTTIQYYRIPQSSYNRPAVVLQKLEYSKLVEIAKMLQRALVVIVLYTPVIISFPVWLFQEYSLLSKGLIKHKWWPQLLVKTIQLSGPTFTKLGQWASSRRDLLPGVACEILSNLQDRNMFYSFNQIKKIIEQEFNSPFNELFSDFEPKPIGVGAIAQVHKATFNDSVVAVKVLHKHARFQIETDLKIISTIANCIDYIVPGAKWLSLPQELQVFTRMMVSQLDLKNEAANLKLFGENFKNNTLVSFPKPLVATEKVLIETFVPGVPISRFMDKSTGFDKAMGRIGLDVFLKMLILDNHVHADLHPGNIIVQFFKPESDSFWLPKFKEKIGFETHSLDFKESDALNSLETSEFLDKIARLDRLDYRARLAIIDAGLVSVLSTSSLQNFLDLFGAVTDFNGKKVAQLMIERSATPETPINKHEFIDEMDRFIKSVQRDTLSLQKVKLSDILAKVLGMVRLHHVKLDGDFANVAVSIMLLEGVGRKLDPTLDLLKESVPLLEMASKLSYNDHHVTRSKFKSKAFFSKLLTFASVFDADSYEQNRFLFLE